MVLDAPIVDAINAAFQRAPPSLIAQVLRGPPPMSSVFMKELTQGVVSADVLISTRPASGPFSMAWRGRRPVAF